MPKVSVLSSTYNHEKYVVDAIESVLQQTFADFELIICDDASTDDNVRRIKTIVDPRMQLIINEENIGNTATSARCWQICHGEYISLLTTDDMYEPDMLETLVNYLDGNSELDGVFALARFIDEDGNLTGESWPNGGVGLSRYELLNSFFYPKNLLCAPAMMIRRSFLEKTGYFPAHLMQLNDMHHWIKMLFHGELKVIDKHLVRYRWRANQANTSAPRAEVSYRLAFESYEVLSLFSDYILDCDLLLKIFPSLEASPWPLEERLIPFHLAQLALAHNHPAWHLYGLHLLYNLLSKPENAAYVKTKCNFGYPDLFRLVAEKRALDHILPGLYADREKELEEAAKDLNILRGKLFDWQSHSLCLTDSEFPPIAGSENILFSDAVRLLRMYSWKCSNGIQILAHWQAEARPELATHVAVHLVDDQGKILSQADYQWQPERKTGAEWRDCFFLRDDQLIGAKALGIALYDDPSQTLAITGGQCDWQNHRLILPLIH